MTDQPNRRSYGPMTRLLAAGVLLFLLAPIPVLAETLKVGGTGAALGAMRILAAEFKATRPDVSIIVPPSLGSGGGIRAVIAGALDIGLSSRSLKTKEKEAGAEQVAFAKSPFVLVVGRGVGNPDLSAAQVVEIFSGRRKTWADGKPIRIILRPEDDTDTKALVAGFEGMKKALARARKIKGIATAYSDQEAMDMAESIPGSLTTATLTAVLAEGRSLTPVAVNGVVPSPDSLGAGTYPLFKILYVVAGPKTGSLAREFIDFIRSDTGAAILRKNGSLPL